MKKLAVLTLLVFLGLNTSQAKMTSVERTFIFHKRSVLMSQTVTKNVLVHAIPRSHKRLLIANNLIVDENDDPPGPDELDLHVSYRRDDIVNAPHNKLDDGELSKYVQVRLAVARARAMAAYRSKFTKDA
jgi:hypothetical protein